MGCGASKEAKPPAAAEPRRNLRRVFDQFDSDANGSLDKRELKRAFKAIGISQIDFDDAFRSFDANGDEVISFEEFDANLHRRTRSKIESLLNDEGCIEGLKPLVDVAAVFAQIDTDNSGTLSIEELTHAFNILDLSTDDMDAVMKTFDTDEDGQISLEEWKMGLPIDVLYAIENKLNERDLIEGFDCNELVTSVEAAPAEEGTDAEANAFEDAVPASEEGAFEEAAPAEEGAFEESTPVAEGDADIVEAPAD